MAFSGWQMAGFDVNVSTLDVAITSILQGIAVGVIWVPLSIASFADMERRYLPETVAVFHLLRNLGSSIFISLSVVVALRTAKVNYAELAEFVSPFNETLRYPWILGRWDLDSTAGLARISDEVARQAAMIGYVNAFYLFMLVSLAVGPLIHLVRGPKRD